jgi:Cu2+-exporting ATPase
MRSLPETSALPFKGVYPPHDTAVHLCHHCGEPCDDLDHQQQIDNKVRYFCCTGCQMISQAIYASGLGHYYQSRTEKAVKLETIVDKLDNNQPSAQQQATLDWYDHPEAQKSFVRPVDNQVKQATLLIEGISCGACVWLIQQYLKRQTGVTEVLVNLSQHRAYISWQSGQAKLSALISALQRIGFNASPYQVNQAEQQLQKENKQALRRLGVAGLGMMQVMMVAVALYAGSWQGIAEHYVHFLRWISLIIATPVVFYAARPFFSAAWRDINRGYLTMDVPVSLAIGLAYGASVWGTLTQSGEVYFDAVSMFTFFLLVGRYCEMLSRHRGILQSNQLIKLIPGFAWRLKDNNQAEQVPIEQLAVGDRLLVKAGDTLAADGYITKGTSSIDESALTGEFKPVRRQPGDLVLAGTINVEQPIELTLSKTGTATRLATIVELLARAQAEKPKIAQLADQVAGYFVAGVLVIATLVSFYWWWQGSSQWFWITLSVLVVTCPCALSLATPTALTCAAQQLQRLGFIITKGHVLASLAKASHIIFDKTGTLTAGRLTLVNCRLLKASPLTKQQLLATVAALEHYSEHPVAQAFKPYLDASYQADQVKVHTGQGLEGYVNGTFYRLGKPGFVQALYSQQSAIEPPRDQQNGQWLLIGNKQQALAWLQLNDQLRPEAASTTKQLIQQGLQVELLSGDTLSATEQMGRQLGLTQATGGVLPEEKLSYIRQLQQQGAQVIMVGDGINDAPVLAGAQCSVAMAQASDLAKVNADSFFTSNNLMLLVQAITIARRTRHIIWQNFSWALGYNLLALPAAIAGWVPPYLAALGMSASSLIVLLNALRLQSSGDKKAKKS